MSKKPKKKKVKSHSKPHSERKKKVEIVEESEAQYQGLKILCFLSFIGFIYCMVIDASQYMTYTNVEQIKNSLDQTGWEQLEELLDDYKRAGIPNTPDSHNRIGAMFAIRCFLNVMAMVGTGLMFYRISRGYYIYLAGQMLYVFVPFLMFGLGALAIFENAWIMVPLIYVGLFTSQRKYFDR